MNRFELISVAVVVFIILWRLSTLVGRLDRVHIRRDQTRRSLFLQLAARGNLVARIVQAEFLPTDLSNELHAAINRLADAAPQSLPDYFFAEGELSQTLREVFAEKDHVRSLMTSVEAGKLLSELADSCQRVALARRFHNDSVGAAQLLHKRKLVRYLRLAGNTSFPKPIDLDDEPAKGFEEL